MTPDESAALEVWREAERCRLVTWERYVRRESPLVEYDRAKDACERASDGVRALLVMSVRP